jgi:hypothetical protein
MKFIFLVSHVCSWFFGFFFFSFLVLIVYRFPPPPPFPLPSPGFSQLTRFCLHTDWDDIESVAELKIIYAGRMLDNAATLVASGVRGGNGEITVHLIRQPVKPGSQPKKAVAVKGGAAEEADEPGPSKCKCTIS